MGSLKVAIVDILNARPQREWVANRAANEGTCEFMSMG